MDQYVSQFSNDFISRAFNTVIAASTKTLGRLGAPQTDENRIKLLKAVVTALEQGENWTPPAALIHLAETKARMQYNSQVNRLLDDLESIIN
jgi:hypothetical protein